MRDKTREYALEKKLNETVEELRIVRLRVARVKRLIDEYCCYCDCNGDYDADTISLRRETLANLADILDGKDI